MKLAFKIDVDTLDGTRVGVENLCKLFLKYNIPATFFFSLGKDQMGRSIFRIFQKGFVKKCLCSRVVGNYSLRTLLSGTILPSPQIAKRCSLIMSAVADRGFDCGVHCLNHYKWQNLLHKMSFAEVGNEFNLACKIFEDVFGFSAESCAAAGWNVSENYLKIQDEKQFLFASDFRGYAPFFAKIGNEVFKTIQIPTTLFTLDELLVSYNLEDIETIQMKSIYNSERAVMTIHAELEGMAYLSWFEDFLKKLQSCQVEFFSLKDYALFLKNNPDEIQICDVEMTNFYNRSGLIAVQK